MKKTIVISLFQCVLMVSGATAWSETIAPAAQAIEQTLRAQWHTPEQPLQLPVIVVQGEVAMVDWLLAEKGGRALLKLKPDGWQTLLCGGTELTNPQRLQQAGLTSERAHALLAALHRKEQTLSADAKARISRFKGLTDFTQPHSVHSPATEHTQHEHAHHEHTTH